MADHSVARNDRDGAHVGISRLLRPRIAWLVALLPLLLAGALIGGLGEGERERTSLDSLPAGFDSTQGTDALPI